MTDPPHLRILTWNLWGYGSPRSYFTDRNQYRGVRPRSRAVEADDGIEVWRHRRPLLAACMASARPDIVCMQECLKPGTTNSQELAADLGLDVTDDSLSPGLAIATRLPMRSVEPLSAFRVDWHGKAKPLHAILTAGSTDVSVVCVHVPLDRFGPRDELFAELASWQSPVGFTILVGDFNAVPTGAEIGTLVAAGYEDVSIESGPTMPNPDPVAKLDYVFARGGPNGLSASADAIGLDADEDGYLPSDHAGVIVELAGPSATALPSPHCPSSEIDL